MESIKGSISNGIIGAGGRGWGTTQIAPQIAQTLEIISASRFCLSNLTTKTAEPTRGALEILSANPVCLDTHGIHRRIHFSMDSSEPGGVAGGGQEGHRK